MTVAAVPQINVKTLQFIHKLTASDTSKTAKITKKCINCSFYAPHFTLVKEALIEIGCVVTSLIVGWLSRACTVAKRCILGL